MPKRLLNGFSRYAAPALFAALLGACGSGGPSDEEIARAGTAYPPEVVQEIENACLDSCTKAADQCQRACTCRRDMIRNRIPYKRYLLLQRKGEFPFKASLNRLTLGCSRV